MKEDFLAWPLVKCAFELHFAGNNPLSEFAMTATIARTATAWSKLVSLVVFSFALVACGQSETTPTDDPTRSQPTANSAEGPASVDAPGDAPADAPGDELVLTVIERFNDLGAPITALAALPDRSEPWKGRAIAAKQGGGLTFIDLTFGELTEVDSPEFSSMVTAPAFQLRGSNTPLIVATGPTLTEVQAYVYIMGNDIFQAVPTEPITVEGGVQLLCAVRNTEALVEFIVVGATEAAQWTLRDDGGDALAAEKVADRPEAAGATACASAGGRDTLFLDADGALFDGVRGLAASVLEHQPNPAEIVNVALIARRGGGFAVADPATGEVLARARIQTGLNAEGIASASKMAVADGNYGGSYNAGALLLSSGDSVVTIALDQAAAILAEAAR